MICGDNETDFIGVDLDDLALFIVDRKLRDAEVGEIVLNGLEDARAIAAIDVDLDVGKLLLVFAEDFGKHVNASSFVGGNDDFTTGNALEFLDRFLGAAAEIENLFGILGKDTPGGSEGESHRPTHPRGAAAPPNVATPTRASVPILGLMVLAAILAVGNMTWWLHRSRAPEPAPTLAATPTATPLTPDPPEPVVWAPAPPVAPTLSAPVVPLAETAHAVSKPPAKAPRPSSRVPVKQPVAPPKPSSSGAPLLFDFPK